MLQNNQRIMIEDALKFIFDCEHSREVATIKNIAGTLAVGADQTTEIIKRLRELKLITFDGIKIQLSPSGKEYALRIIRVHRLWEQYLSERTGVPENAWHNEADIIEHSVTDDQVNEIDHMLGYPRYDPHGDPIPTVNGEMPSIEGRSLNDFAPGKAVVITHIEDEPKSIYTDLITKNISLGMILQIQSTTDEELLVLVEGKQVQLTRMESANITVRPSETEAELDISTEDLTVLDIGENAEVVSISKACRGPQRRRLMDLGILPGTVVTAEMKSLGGDPTAFNVRGAKIALRNSTARFIKIKRQIGVA